MRTIRKPLLLASALSFGCGGDDSSSSDSGADTTGISVGDTSSASTATATATAPMTDGDSTAVDGSGGSSSDGGAGSGLVVPCDDEGTADPDVGIICFFGVDGDPMEPAATIEHSVGEFDGQDALYIRLTLAPWFADNTYGVNAIGWPNEHKFRDLTGSDHAEIHLRDPMGNTVFHFKTDYITDDDTAASGYLSLGVWGGEGEVLDGDETQILAATSSISRNLNDRGYAEYVVDSPATDESYTPNPETPEWDYRVVYEIWIALAAFSPDVLPVSACIENIHASPSKLDSNTVDVVPDECPPGWGCWKTDGCGECDYYDPDLGDLCDPTAGGVDIP
jgi:hypothetical protein